MRAAPPGDWAAAAGSHPPSQTSSPSKRVNGQAGEKGESREHPHQSTDSDGRSSGDSGRTSQKELDALTRLATRTLTASSPAELQYPIDSLGPLAEVGRAISVGAQVAPAMAGQCVLAVAALLGQSRHNVRALSGVRPLSLYMLSIGDSGVGKTTTEMAALSAVRDYQRAATKKYRTRLAKNHSVTAPPQPYRLTRDGTAEGLRNSFRDGLASQGVFTSEAAMMLCGHGMNAENRLKTAATFNALFDDGEVSVSRSIAGRIQLYGQRLSLHWLIQPDAARAALHDPLLSAIGFWPRFLVAWPSAPMPRKARLFAPQKDASIRAFLNRCAHLVKQKVPDALDKLPALELSSPAQTQMNHFFEKCEREAKSPSGQLTSIKPFALRATEHAYRLAGVLDAGEIDLATARNAIALTTYSLDTWLVIYGDREDAEATQLALTLFRWLASQLNTQASETAILKVGPKALRSRSRRDTALALLELHGLVGREGNVWFVTSL
jgi:hypothetical protein